MKKNKRLQVMSVIYMIGFALVFLVIFGRFLYIQASGQVGNVSLDELAKEKRATNHTLKAERGKIHDTNGMPLAFDRQTFKMYAILSEDYTLNSSDPNHVEDIETTAEQLAPILDVEQSSISDTLETGIQSDKWQVEFGNIGKNLSQKKKEEIEDLDIPGINFEQESIRYYPNGEFASHILGFAGEEQENNEEEDQDEEDEQRISGIMGIEKEMNDFLNGHDGYISYERDGYLNKLLYPNETVQQPQNGFDIDLTIDQKVQTLLEDMLTQTYEEYDPERITAIVMDAKTGEVKAMSNRPSYDPNHPTEVENWYNDAISTPYEPGSTIKMFTWAAAIDSGVYQGDESFKSGKYQINKTVEPIHDHNEGEGWGKISFDEGLHRSSNVAASRLVWEELGPDEYLDYLERFDFDKKTNIDLPGEKNGEILYNWPIEKLTTSFGQGSTLTPIQQMKAATAIANGGEMLQPYVIKQIVDNNSNEMVEKNEPKIVSEPISEETASEMLELLQGVVHSEEGTGRAFELNDYTLAGKTGTAEIPNPDGSGYLSGRSDAIYSFLGMAPAEDPELMMYVSVKQPDLAEDEQGSAPVAHIFTNVMENSLRYLDISPEEESEELDEPIIIPELIDKNIEQKYEELTQLGLNVTIIGEGETINHANVQSGAELIANDRVLLMTDEPTMPDITGWSLRDTLQLAHMVELEIDTVGSGYVIKQSIDEGVSLEKQDNLDVELVPPDEQQSSEEDSE